MTMAPAALYNVNVNCKPGEIFFGDGEIFQSKKKHVGFGGTIKEKKTRGYKFTKNPTPLITLLKMLKNNQNFTEA